MSRPTMTKQTYIRAAAIVRATLEFNGAGDKQAKAAAHAQRNAFVALFEADNPKFDVARFDAATGLFGEPTLQARQSTKPRPVRPMYTPGLVRRAHEQNQEKCHAGCKGWVISTSDAHGTQIERCDECWSRCGVDVRDEDVQQLPEAKAELRRVLKEMRKAG